MSHAISPFVAESPVVPVDLAKIYQAVQQQLREIVASKLSTAELHRRLKQGVPGTWVAGCDIKQLRINDSFAPVGRTLLEIQTYLEQLIMWDQCPGARDFVISVLALDDPDDTAKLLTQLNESHPEIVTELLHLRVVQAYRLMRREGLLVDLQLTELVVEIARIGCAFQLRLIAMEAGDRLHNPTAYAPIDRSDPGNTTRVKFPRELIQEQIKVLEKVLRLYRGESISVETAESEFRDKLRPCSISAFALMTRPASDGGNDLLMCSLEKQLAEKAEPLLRKRHGHQLERVLEAAIKDMEAQLNVLKQRLAEETAKFHFNQRVGNLCPVEPLMRLYVACRFAVALSDKTRGECGLSRLIKSEKPDNEPIIVPHREHFATANSLFATLRYEFVLDDYMLPEHLDPVDPATGKKMRSQFDAERLRGRPFSFDELMPDGDRTMVPRWSSIRDAYNELMRHGLNHVPAGQRKVIEGDIRRLAGLTVS